MLVLDSTAIIEVLNGSQIGAKIRGQLSEDTVTTALSVYEVGRGMKEQQKEHIAHFFEQIPICACTKSTAERSAQIEKELRNTGKMINQIDILIAGICQELDATIVTLDKDFLKVPKLRVRMMEK